MGNGRDVEVRAGLVLYGGSSLAVYMGGVAQEFLHAVRACQDDTQPYHDLLKAMRADFVVDVISGTSAGGINGVFLARALATGGSMDHMRDLWRDVGDFANLLDWGNNKQPKSLLNGQYFQDKLAEALSKINGPAPLVPVLDLHLTTTDLYGRYWQRQDFLGHTVLGRQHTKYFRLKLRRSQEELGDENGFLGYDMTENPFVGDNAKTDQDRIAHLAKLARTTAAFPAMFQPVDWKQEEAYKDEADETADQREKVWMSDGGILDNQPFTPALKTIYERAATQQVDRLLFYVEPDPVDKTVPADSDRNLEPSALRVAWSVLDLRMYQGIQQHLQSIETHNRVVENVQQLVDKITAQLNEDEFRDGFENGPLRKGYSVLRSNHLAAYVRDELTRAYGICRNTHPDLPEQADLTWLPRADNEAYWGKFLETADPTYIKRKLHFLIEQTTRKQPLVAGHPEKQELEMLIKLETLLWKLLQVVRDAEWKWWEGREIADLFAAGAKADPEQLYRGLAGIVTTYNAALDQVTADLVTLLTTLQLTNQWESFNAYDVVLYPLAIGSSFGERDVIDWVRISPYDADTLAREDPSDRSPLPDSGREIYGRRKIAGDTLGHFGGFLSPRWRANDFMWGRLDAADQIISTLVEAARKASWESDEFKQKVEAGEAAGVYPRYSPGELTEILAQAEAARTQAFRLILAEELDDAGLEKLGARAYAHYAADERALVRWLLAPEAQRNTQKGDWSAEQSLDEAAIAELTPELLIQANQKWQQLVRTAFHQQTAFPVPGTAVGEPADKADRRAWLQALIRSHASWQDMRKYLTEEHNVGEEDIAKLHPAVLANTAVDLAENARLVIGQTISSSKLKVPGPVEKAGKWLTGAFVRIRQAVKLFLPRPKPGEDDRMPPKEYWLPGAVAVVLVAFLVPLTQWLYNSLGSSWPWAAVTVAAMAGVLGLLYRFFPQWLAGMARLLPLAGVRTLLLVLAVAVIGDGRTIRGWNDKVTLFGLHPVGVLTFVRDRIGLLLFALLVYDALLVAARFITRSVQELPESARKAA